MQPYAQWTFDTPIERVIYRADGSGFPIQTIVTTEYVRLYDSTGTYLNEIARDETHDRVVFNSSGSRFMFVREEASERIEAQQRLYSFRVFKPDGNPGYTLIQPVDLLGSDLDYHFTEEGTLILAEKNRPWIVEVGGEDTLAHYRGCEAGLDGVDRSEIRMAKLMGEGSVAVANACWQSETLDTVFTTLRLWERGESVGDAAELPGIVSNIFPVEHSDYFFLELDNGLDRDLLLFHQDQALHAYPWSSWKISRLDKSSVFVISDQDFNVVSLGDGSVAASYHPIDMSTISDAIYLSEWDMFLYVRFESYFTKEGEQAFRRFELEGVSRAGRIVHRSSFGTWSYSLPKLDQVGKDLFAIHIHNAVLMYRIELIRD